MGGWRKLRRRSRPFRTAISAPPPLYSSQRHRIEARKHPMSPKIWIDPRKSARPSVFIIVDLIAVYPREMYEKGISLITSSVIRNHPNALSARIKSLNYLNNILAKIEANDAGAAEAVMLNHEGNV